MTAELNAWQQDLRYELKLPFDEHYLPRIMIWLEKHSAGIRPVYKPRQVNSLYFDTPDYASYQANLHGIAQRRKLRLRWYGKNSGFDNISAVLELKYKEGILGGKLRYKVPMPLDLNCSYRQLLTLLRKSLSVEPEGANKTLQVAFQGQLQPTLLNHYWRRYFISADRQVRVTVDTQQVMFDQKAMIYPNHKRPIPPSQIGQHAAVIELKAPSDQVQRLQQMISSFPIRRNKYSKYVTGVSRG